MTHSSNHVDVYQLDWDNKVVSYITTLTPEQADRERGGSRNVYFTPEHDFDQCDMFPEVIEDWKVSYPTRLGG